MNTLSLRSLERILAFGIFVGSLTVPAAIEALAQGRPGSFLIYGNFCGPGNRGPGYPPIDALDLACAHHDACSPGSGIPPACSCNRRLQVESGLVARDPRTPQRTRDMANVISSFAESAPCQ